MIEDRLIQFVSRMQTEFSHIIFRFEYNKVESLYRIWHTACKPGEDHAFLSAMGALIEELFIPIGFFDFYFELNADYSHKLSNVTDWKILKVFSEQPRVQWIMDQIDSFGITSDVDNYMRATLRDITSKMSFTPPQTDMNTDSIRDKCEPVSGLTVTSKHTQDDSVSISIRNAA